MQDPDTLSSDGCSTDGRNHLARVVRVNASHLSESACAQEPLTTRKTGDRIRSWRKEMYSFFVCGWLWNAYANAQNKQLISRPLARSIRSVWWLYTHGIWKQMDEAQWGWLQVGGL